MMSPYCYPGIQQLGIRNVKNKSQIERDVMSLISKKTGVSSTDILGNVRRRNILEARQIYCFVMREIYKYSFSEIAYSLGRHEHTATLHSIKKIRELASVEFDTYKKLYEICVAIDYNFAKNLTKNLEL